MIIDEFTNLPVSRQRKYQLRKLKIGKCIICGENRVTAHHCEEHAAQANELAKAAYHRNALITKALKRQGS